jgi:hypothetical protein
LVLNPVGTDPSEDVRSAGVVTGLVVSRRTHDGYIAADRNGRAKLAVITGVVGEHFGDFALSLSGSNPTKQERVTACPYDRWNHSLQ